VAVEVGKGVIVGTVDGSSAGSGGAGGGNCLGYGRGAGGNEQDQRQVNDGRR
jgi:hypothetical protein